MERTTNTNIAKNVTIGLAAGAAIAFGAGTQLTNVYAEEDVNALQAEENGNDELTTAENNYQLSQQETADRQTAVNEASGNKDTAEAEVKTAQTEVDAAMQEAEQAVQAVDAATAEVVNTQNALEETDLALQDAQAAETSSKEAVEAQKTVVEEESRKVDLDAYGTIETDLESAKADALKAETALKEAEAEQAQAETNKQDAETALDEAIIEQANAENEKVQAEADLENAENKVEEETQNVTKCEAELESAKQEYENAQTVESAKQAEADAAEKKAEFAQLDANIESAQNTVNSTNKSIDEAESSILVLSADAEAKRAEADSLKALAENATEQLAKGSIGYFESLGTTEGDKCVSALEKYEKNYSWMKAGEEGSATSLDNMLKALDYIDECNEIRKGLGLSELTVNDYLMALAQVSSDYNAFSGDFNHLAGTYLYSQNISGWSNPFAGWYTSEKKIFDQYAAQDATLESYRYSAINVSRYYPSIYAQTGHYLNIVDKTASTTGFAVATNGRSMKSTQNFDYSGSYAYRSTGVSTSAYREKLEAYISNLENASENYEKANTAAAEAETALSNAKNELGKLQDALLEAQDELQDAKDAKDAFVSANGTVDLEGKTFEQIKQELADQQNAYEQAKLNTKNMKEAVEAKQQALKDAQDSLDDASFAKTNAETALSDAEDKAAETKKAVDDAQIVLTDAENTVGEKTSLVEEGKKALDQAKAAVSEKEAVMEQYGDYYNAVKKLDSLKQAYQDAMQIREEAEAAMQEAKDAYADALEHYDAETADSNAKAEVLAEKKIALENAKQHAKEAREAYDLAIADLQIAQVNEEYARQALDSLKDERDLEDEIVQEAEKKGNIVHDHDVYVVRTVQKQESVHTAANAQIDEAESEPVAEPDETIYFESPNTGDSFSYMSLVGLFSANAALYYAVKKRKDAEEY